MTSREQFEAWWEQERYDDKLSYVQGVMFNHIKANMFLAWQASRNVEIELPAVEKWRSVDAVRAQNAYKVSTIKTLVDEGFKVKGE